MTFFYLRISLRFIFKIKIGTYAVVTNIDMYIEMYKIHSKSSFPHLHAERFSLLTIWHDTQTHTKGIVLCPVLKLAVFS